MPELNLVQAINQGLSQAMEADDRVVVFGEDVGKNGGVFRVTDGLQKRFGEGRVLDTPLAEMGIVGAAIGMAIYGLRPVCEIQFEGFLASALDQVIYHMGRMRNRTRGRYSVPMVLRAPHGGLVHAPEHHSESPEAHFTHTPGIKVLVPSTPEDAKGLIISAIEDPDPVVFFEPKSLYRSIKAEVPEKPYRTPIGKARVARHGDDVSVIAWGAMVHTALKAAAQLDQEDKTSVEVLDLRTLTPLDIESVLATARKTGRVVIAHEAPNTGSWAAEISALIHERAMLKLQAPVMRVGAWDIRMPLFRLEKYYVPDSDWIVRSVRKSLAY